VNSRPTVPLSVARCWTGTVTAGSTCWSRCTRIRPKSISTGATCASHAWRRETTGRPHNPITMVPRPATSTVTATGMSSSPPVRTRARAWRTTSSGYSRQRGDTPTRWPQGCRARCCWRTRWAGAAAPSGPISTRTHGPSSCCSTTAARGACCAAPPVAGRTQRPCCPGRRPSISISRDGRRPVPWCVPGRAGSTPPWRVISTRTVGPTCSPWAGRPGQGCGSTTVAVASTTSPRPAGSSPVSGRASLSTQPPATWTATVMRTWSWCTSTRTSVATPSCRSGWPNPTGSEWVSGRSAGSALRPRGRPPRSRVPGNPRRSCWPTWTTTGSWISTWCRHPVIRPRPRIVSTAAEVTVRSPRSQPTGAGGTRRVSAPSRPGRWTWTTTATSISSRSTGAKWLPVSPGASSAT